LPGSWFQPTAKPSNWGAPVTLALLNVAVAGYIYSESKLPDQDWAVCSKALHLVGNIKQTYS
jgi:hypothetical protein